MKCKCCIFRLFDGCALDCDVDADFCDDFEKGELDFSDYECCIEFELMEEMIRESIEEEKLLDIEYQKRREKGEVIEPIEPIPDLDDILYGGF